MSYVLKCCKGRCNVRVSRCYLPKFKRRISTMAYVITDECVACGTCAEECPAEAISEGDGKYVIDADACLDCGTCEAACPTGAISAE